MNWKEGPKQHLCMKELYGPVSRQEDKVGAQGMNPVHKEDLMVPLDNKFYLRLCAYNNYSTYNLKMIEL